MKALYILGAILIVLLIVSCGGGLAALSGYNRVIAMETDVEEAWSKVENVIQRRYDLIPNLVSTVKGVAGQEEKIFLGIAESRQAYFSPGATREQKVAAANQLESALSRLLVFTENYPQLRSSEAFNKLMDELSGSENRISVERMRYNESVGRLNSYIRQIPGRFYAQWAGVEQAEFFESVPEAAEPPKVDFSSPSPATTSEPVEVAP